MTLNIQKEEQKPFGKFMEKYSKPSSHEKRSFHSKSFSVPNSPRFIPGSLSPRNSPRGKTSIKIQPQSRPRGNTNDQLKRRATISYQEAVSNALKKSQSIRKSGSKDQSENNNSNQEEYHFFKDAIYIK